jgi:NAD-dependent SIR2 family protein deacetylase
MAPETRALGTFIAESESLAVLSGAGVSTSSGIPDYRDRNGDWKQSQPIQYGDFMRSEGARRRYWSRSCVGWQRFSAAAPNAAHYALARLEKDGRIDTIITQNVDGLHTEAGSRAVIDLHGRLSKVRCTDCGIVSEREGFQMELLAANPGWNAEALKYRPDGDAELSDASAAGFSVPGCSACGGVVKPDVVMFGEAVPRERVASAMDAVDRADALLVVGSSLMVFSGFRFARRASENGKAIAIVNRGRTRADELATLKIDEDCSAVIPDAVAAVTAWV